MGFRTLHLTGNASQTTYTINGDADKGTLVHASALVDRLTAPPGSTWAMLEIYNEGDELFNRIAALAQGYVSSQNSIMWTGRIPLDHAYKLGLRIKSNASEIVRAVFIVEET